MSGSADPFSGKEVSELIWLRTEVTRLQESLDYQIRYLELIETRNHELRARVKELEEREGNYKTEIARLRNAYLTRDYNLEG